MKNLFILAPLLLIATSSFAIVKPGWERPILSADMKVTKAEFGFAHVSDVKLTLTRQDPFISTEKNENFTGIQVQYLIPDRNGKTMKVSQQLMITEVKKDDCGSTVYYSQLKQPKNDELGARFSVVLTDHTTRLCEDYRPYRWEAHVRQGYGFCGTGDATMELIGNPEGVITIQSFEGTKLDAIRSALVPMPAPQNND